MPAERGPTSSRERSVALLLVAALLAAGGCGGPRPHAPYEIAVRDSHAGAVIRTDVDDREARRRAADTIRSAEAVLLASTSPPFSSDDREPIIWFVSAERTESILRRLGADDNTGAATIPRRRGPETFAVRPGSTATAEGDAVQRLHADFVLAHEYTHAWVGPTSSGDLDEGFANWVALRAVGERIDTGMRYDGPSGLATIVPQILTRAEVVDGKPPPDLLATGLDPHGEAAYALGLSAFLFLDEERKDDAAFRSLTMDALRRGRLRPDAIADRLRPAPAADSPGTSLEARFRAWWEARDAADRRWWLVLGFLAIGSSGPDRVLLADAESTVMLSFADPEALSATMVERDRLAGRPPLERIQELAVTVHGTGLRLGSGTRPGESPLVRISTRHGDRPLRDGEQLRIRCQGERVSLLSADTPIAVWEDGAGRLFEIEVDGRMADGRTPVVELVRIAAVRSHQGGPSRDRQDTTELPPKVR
jgi:hypothetical protein